MAFVAEGKAAKNQMHLDLNFGDRGPAEHQAVDAEVERLVGLGGRLPSSDERAPAGECELFLAVGTSLSVYPAAGLCDHALAAGARLAVLNAVPTRYDRVADAVSREPVGEVLTRLVAAAG